MIRRLFPWIYLVWIVLCGVLFFALRGLEDPSRPKGAILSIEAGQRALAIGEAHGLRGYEVVHVARAEERWVVLLDRVPHTDLRAAVVVEVDLHGKLLRVRRAPV